jgi:cyclopropane fatty-acyl-phospholipid synthase-like methyltransferase
LKNKTFFYDSLYEEGFTTELPSDQKLGNLIESNFSDHEKDFSEIIKILKALGVDSGARILDFGCSWGYGTYQLRKAGYNAEGLEISQRRAEFGRKKFNLEISDSLENVRPGFDVFFSSHVLEHVPSLTETIELAMSKIRPGGIFVAFTPNGSLDYRQKSFADFHSQWGKVHPRCLTDNFYKRIFKENIMLMASNPFDVVQIQKWDKSSLRVMDLSGSGLLAVAIAKE